MSETVSIALVTALAGFGGALLGAAGAVFGPWWLQKTERAARERAEQFEVRRAAIVEWTRVQIRLAGEPDPDTIRDLAAQAIAAQAALTSHLAKGQHAVEDFVHGVNVYATMHVDDDLRRSGTGLPGGCSSLGIAASWRPRV